MIGSSRVPRPGWRPACGGPSIQAELRRAPCWLREHGMGRDPIDRPAVGGRLQKAAQAIDSARFAPGIGWPRRSSLTHFGRGRPRIKDGFWMQGGSNRRGPAEYGRAEMAPQGLEKIGLARGKGMAPASLDPQDLVREGSNQCRHRERERSDPAMKGAAVALDRRVASLLAMTVPVMTTVSTARNFLQLQKLAPKRLKSRDRRRIRQAPATRPAKLPAGPRK